MNPKEKIQISRLKLKKSHPYLTTALFSLSLKDSDKIQTMAVDKYWRLYYNPAFVESLEIPQIVAVLYHEILHLLRKHHRRAENLPYDFRTINIAEDAEINDDIRREGFKLPGGAIYPETIGCKENDIFENYLNNAQKYVNQTAGDSQENLPFGGGSGSDGRKKPWEDGSPSESGVDGVGDDSAVIRKTASDIKSESSKSPGSVPGHLKDLADSILPNREIKPDKILKRYLTQSIELTKYGEDSLTYAKLHRKQGQYASIRIPAGVSGKVNICVILDTSGSMLDIMRESLGIVYNFAKHENLSVNIISIDTEIENVSNGESLTKSKILKIATGGGGTDLTPAIEFSRKFNPAAVVIITDCYTSWTSHKPCKCDVIVIKPEDSGKSPEWAKEIVWKTK